MAKKALITGIGGFAGGHLASFLLGQGLEVSGITREPVASSLEDATGNKVSMLQVDLMDKQDIDVALRETSPDFIFHLAAQAHVPTSWQDPESTLTNNIVGQLHLLQSAVEHCPDATVLVVGSNEEYGPADESTLPIKEDALLRPTNPYAVSKVAQDVMGYQFYVGTGLKCIRVRPFNHIGPGQREDFVASAFAKQIVEAEMGIVEPVVKVGNLSAKRDFTDVRDIVRGYLLAVIHGDAGDVYNIGSGRAISIQYVLDFLISKAKTKITSEIDQSRFRPVDVPLIYCDYSKFNEKTGWEPTISIENTLEDVLEYWRSRINR